MKIEALNIIAGKVKEIAAETLWPTRCAVCDLPGDILCHDCKNGLLYIDELLACEKCGAPFGTILCTECNDVMLQVLQQHELPMQQMRSAVMLDDAARRIVVAYKDKSERRLAPVIAELICARIPENWLTHIRTLTYVPDTLAAVRRRGFDHSRELAEEAARISGLELLDLLDRPKTSDQRKLTREQRLRNMTSVLHVKEDACVPKAIILMDDVCTTGSTLFAAANALKNAGAKEIYAVTFGRVIA